MIHQDFEHHAKNIEEIIRASNDVFEGNCVYLHQTFTRDENLIPKQRNLMRAAKHGNRILEIGFNAGHSTLLFLLSNPECTVQAFDLGNHSYARPCCEYLQEQFPGRLNVLWGDSTVTIPLYIVDHINDPKFDVLHLDGGHMSHVARSDFRYTRLLSHEDSWVIIDDTRIPQVQVVYQECQDILKPVYRVFEQTLLYAHQLCQFRNASFGTM